MLKLALGPPMPSAVTSAKPAFSSLIWELPILPLKVTQPAGPGVGSWSLSGTDKFAGVAWSPSEVTGSPILEGALAWIDCQIEEIRGGGDHFVVFCRILALGAHSDARPLIFFRAGFQQMH
jgi:flavin reductase (DIM6/NTAB) family NADH-FMN oxidoreductase RutF